MRRAFGTRPARLRPRRACGSPSRRRPGAAPGPRSESGQALALGIVWVGLALILMLAVPGLALGYVDHMAAQSAADAAALACASRATIRRYVDARGEVYGQTLAVAASRGPEAAAAAWGDNIAYWPLQTLAFAAVPSGAHCTVRAEVRSTLPLLHLLRRGGDALQFATTAAAKAYLAPP